MHLVLEEWPAPAGRGGWGDQSMTVSIGVDGPNEAAATTGAVPWINSASTQPDSLSRSETQQHKPAHGTR